MKKLAILGSTGSIGTQTLEILDNDSDFEVELLAVGKNIDLLEKQIIKYKPHFAYIEDNKAFEILKQRLNLNNNNDCELLNNLDDLLSLIKYNEYYMIINAIVGMKGILPTLKAVEAGKTIAIANKETLVCAGHILTVLAKKTGAKILPIDSEHSAIMQCLQGEKRKNIDHIIITASGGPFYKKDDSYLKNVSIKDALKHPNWNMGAKISIDSATMVNKALEVMEAKWLFDLSLDKIKVLIHRKSIVHSLVCFKDGAIKAQMGVTDMKVPISYALYKYDRINLPARLDLTKIGSIEFYEVPKDAYEGFYLGLQAAQINGSMPTVYNAANELAVSHFLNKKIGFLDIAKTIDKFMCKHKNIENPSIDDILNIEKEIKNQ